MVDELNDVRIIGIITAIAVMGIATAGLSWESKVGNIYYFAFRPMTTF